MDEPERSVLRRAAFEAEALPHLPKVYAAARRLLHSEADAEDLVQETYLRAYRTFDNFAAGTNGRAWLLTILHSVFANRWRRMRREPESRSSDELEARAAQIRSVGSPVEPQLTAVMAGKWGAGEVVSAALDRLPETFRTPVVLVDLEELTYEEAALVLECPVGTVRSRLSRGRRRLAKDLEAHAQEFGLAGISRS